MDDELVAVDVLMLLDGAALELVEALNARIVGSVPTGFAFDGRHTPHVTLLQRFVPAESIDEVGDAVGAELAAVPVSSIELTALRLAHQEIPSMPGVCSVVVSLDANRVVVDLQTALVAATAPWACAGGDATAFVRGDHEPEIDAATVDYVERFVPDHSGADFAAHVTIGMATLDDLAALEAEPFEPFTFRPDSFAIYRLGNHGTARTRVRRWPPS